VHRTSGQRTSARAIAIAGIRTIAPLLEKSRCVQRCRPL
jgi:hypothetical protein